MCEYSVYTRLQELITFATIILGVGYMTSIYMVCIFLFSFIFLRKRTGGYHCETSLACLITSIVVTYLNVYFLNYLVLIRLEYFLTIYLISVTCILMLAPINHPNLNMSFDEMKGNKSKILIRLFIITLILILFLLLSQLESAVTLIMSVVSVTISITLSKILKQEVIF